MAEKTKDLRLDYRPRPWQLACHKARKRFSVLVLHRRAGKTELALMELIESALRCTHPLPLFAYIAPQLKQAKAIAWSRLKQRLDPMRLVGAVDYHEADLAVTFAHNGARLMLFGADNPDGLRGMRLDGVTIDEVAQIAPEVWQDVIQPALSDRLGWALFIGTPSGINLFSELYFGAQDKKDWFAGRWTVDDTDALDRAEVERLRSEMPPTSFAREYLCDFTASGVDQLLSLSDVDIATRRTYREQDIGHSPRIMGVDPARFGDDRSVIAKRQGLQAFPSIVLRGLDNMALAARVANEIDVWKPDAVFIDAGAGAGVIDRLRQMHHVVVEIPFGSRSSKKEYANRRAEIWCEMAAWVKSGGAIPREAQSLRTELATPTFWFDNQGRKVLESKEEIKKRLQGGGSPDEADALALTFSASVQRKVQHLVASSAKGSVSSSADYNPLSLRVRF